MPRILDLTLQVSQPARVTAASILHQAVSRWTGGLADRKGSRSVCLRASTNDGLKDETLPGRGMTRLVDCSMG